MRFIATFVFLISLSVHAVIPLTGSGSLPKGRDFGDPSPPKISSDKVEVFTTGGFILTWKNIDDLLSGKAARLSHFKLQNSDEDIWDPTIEDGVLYGGVINGEDWSRRVYAFRNVNGKWVRETHPLSGPLPRRPTWLGHSYGHHFIDGYMFYEKVTEERNDAPWTTEIFARKMKDAFHLTGPEIPILKLSKDWARTRRSFGGKLVEGPRPFKANGIYFISFSAGDYTSDDYGIHLMASKNLLGPYEPYLTPDKKDLKDFAGDIEKQLPLTWGGARAAFFEANNKHWALFHGIKDDGSSAEGLRNVWLSPVTIDNCRDVHCQIKLK